MTPEDLYHYSATVERVIDGDTLVLDLDLGFFVHHVHDHARILGINAPEITGDTKEAGLAAKAYAEQLAPVGTTVLVWSRKLDSFGRILCSLTLSDGSDFAFRMIEAGQAVAYSP